MNIYQKILQVSRLLFLIIIDSIKRKLPVPIEKKERINDKEIELL